jgi:hypothetical protein
MILDVHPGSGFFPIPDTKYRIPDPQHCFLYFTIFVMMTFFKIFNCFFFRYVKNGHVSSYLFHQNVFRKAIYDSLDRYNVKYPA